MPTGKHPGQTHTLGAQQGNHFILYFVLEFCGTAGLQLHRYFACKHVTLLGSLTPGSDPDNLGQFR